MPPKLKIQEYSTLLCFDRVQTFWNVMLFQWMSGSLRFAGLWTVMPSFSRIKPSMKNSYFSWTTDPEDQSITILENTGKHSPSYPATQLHILEDQSLALPLWEPDISHSYIYATQHSVSYHITAVFVVILFPGVQFSEHILGTEILLISPLVSVDVLCCTVQCS